MTPNVGTIDRILRAGLGLVLLYLAFFSGLAAMDGAVLKYGAILVGIVMLATAAFKLCPLYSMLGLKTCKEC